MSDVKVMEMVTNESGCSDILSWHGDKEAGADPDTRYAVQLIPIPDGYRLATEEDRAGEKPEGYKCSSSDQVQWVGNSSHNPAWHDDVVYIVPIRTERDELLAELESARATIKAVEDKLGAL